MVEAAGLIAIWAIGLLATETVGSVAVVAALAAGLATGGAARTAAERDATGTASGTPIGAGVVAAAAGSLGTAPKGQSEDVLAAAVVIGWRTGLAARIVFGALPVVVQRPGTPTGAGVVAAAVGALGTALKGQSEDVVEAAVVIGWRAGLAARILFGALPGVVPRPGTPIGAGVVAAAVGALGTAPKGHSEDVVAAAVVIGWRTGLAARIVFGALPVVVQWPGAALFAGVAPG